MKDVIAEQEKLTSIVQQTLAAAQQQGASDAEAGISEGSGLSVSVRMGEVDTLEHHRNRRLGVTVYFGQRKGSASTSDFSPAAVQETVQAACDIARYTSEDAYAGLADPALLATQVLDLDLYHPWSLNSEQAIDLALQCEQAGRNSDLRITNSQGASLSTYQGSRVYGNSNGFLGGYPASRHSMSCSFVAGSDAQMQRDHWYSVARDAGELEAPEQIGLQAAQRTVRRLDAQQLTTRKVPVLFSAEVATGLVGHFIAAIRGANLYRKSSFLVDHLGKTIFPEFVHMEERPHIPKALGSASFDQGVLQGYVLDSYAARKLKLQTTGNAGGVHNLTVASNAGDLAALLRQMDRGLLVVELIGQGINMVTGDYSRGAAGFWVEQGAIVHPVQEVTIAGNLRSMYQQIISIGEDKETRGNIHTGSILIEEMTVAGG